MSRAVAQASSTAARFNGAYGHSSDVSNCFNFDSWRTNSGTNLWLPTFVFTEQGNPHDPQAKRFSYRAFCAQTRLLGYHLAPVSQEQELSKMTLEDTSINDQTQTITPRSSPSMLGSIRRNLTPSTTWSARWTRLSRKNTSPAAGIFLLRSPPT